MKIFALALRALMTRRIMTNQAPSLFSAVVLVSALTFTANSDAAGATSDEEVNVYSARHYDTDMALYEEFTRQTGIKVNLIEGGSDALIERIRNEGEFSPADMLITVDAGRLWRAGENDIFQAIDSDLLNERVPQNLRDPDGLWFGLSKREYGSLRSTNRPDFPSPLPATKTWPTLPLLAPYACAVPPIFITCL